jgi:hypothetical protein
MDCLIHRKVRKEKIELKKCNNPKENEISKMVLRRLLIISKSLRILRLCGESLLYA